MTDGPVLVRVARDLIAGMTSSFGDKESLKNFKPPRRGTCLVERCARFVEEVCFKCGKADCQRCAIAAELRAAEEQINADRDAELLDQFGSQELEHIVDNLVQSLCGDHGAFGPVLLKQWYARRSFIVDPPAVDADVLQGT